jgi:hypothetical protein
MQPMKLVAVILLVGAALFVVVAASGDGGKEPGTIDVAGYRLYPAPATAAPCSTRFVAA